MRSQSVLTLCLLFWLSFGVVWKVAKAYYLPEEPDDDDDFVESQKRTTTSTTRRITPFKPKGKVVQTLRSKRSKDQVDNSAILLPKDNGDPKCEDTHTCSTLENCHPFSKKNSICGWNGPLPLVCCLKNQTKIPLDKGIISENECFRNEKKEDWSPFYVSEVAGKSVNTITKWPFMVSLFKKIGTNRMFICGGSLISRKHVLTAAHCFLNRESGSEYDVISGLVNLKSFENNRENFTIHPVTNINVHPNFKFPQLHDDIAILTIPSIDTFSPKTRPVCLSLGLMENGDTGKGSVLGWGKTRSYGEKTDVLQVVPVDFVNRSTCEIAFKMADANFTRKYPGGISPGIVCAENRLVPEDTCKGDSGGPLVVHSEDNVWRLVGVVSTGFECRRVGSSGIYTRVSSYLEWIETTAAIN